jgi:hypothetical protein
MQVNATSQNRNQTAPANTPTTQNLFKSLTIKALRTLFHTDAGAGMQQIYLQMHHKYGCKSCKNLNFAFRSPPPEQVPQERRLDNPIILH